MYVLHCYNDIISCRTIYLRRFDRFPVAKNDPSYINLNISFNFGIVEYGTLSFIDTLYLESNRT